MVQCFEFFPPECPWSVCQGGVDGILASPFNSAQSIEMAMEKLGALLLSLPTAEVKGYASFVLLKME